MNKINKKWYQAGLATVFLGMCSLATVVLSAEEGTSLPITGPVPFLGQSPEEVATTPDKMQSDKQKDKKDKKDTTTTTTTTSTTETDTNQTPQTNNVTNAPVQGSSKTTEPANNGDLIRGY